MSVFCRRTILLILLGFFGFKPGFAQTLPDSCYRSFLKSYGISPGRLEMKDVCRTSDGGYVLVGSKLPAPSTAVIKLSKTGAVEWSKDIDFFHNVKVLLADDGNFIVVTNTYLTQLTKFSNNGNILWSKELENVGGYDLRPDGIQKTNDGGFVMIFNGAYGTGFMFNYIIRIDANANIIWKKEILHNSSGPMMKSLVVENNSIFIAADFYDLGGLQQIDIVRLDLVSGAIIWKKRLVSENLNLFEPHLAKVNDSLVVSIISTESIANGKIINRVSIAILDANSGKKLMSYKFLNPRLSFTPTYYAINSVGPSHFAKTGDNNLVFSQQVYFNNDTALNVTKFNTGGDVLWSKNYKNYKKQDVWSVKSDGDELLICGRRYVTRANNTDISFLMRLDHNGNAAAQTVAPGADCYNEDIIPETEAMPLTEDFSDYLNTVDNGSITITDYTPVFSTFTTLATDACSVIDSTCNSLSVAGPDSVCRSVLVTYTAKRNEGCTKPVHWIYDPLFVKPELVTDTSISLRFLNAGNTGIQARLNNSCSEIIIDKTVYVNKNAETLNLGPDQDICSPGSIILNAKKGFTSYLWNDGSLDSVLTVSIPGKYYVLVSDICGNLFSDTVVVSPLSVSFDIGPGRSKCNNDALQISAPAGFLNYTWGPVYNINSTTVREVIVQPAIDTFYFVRAEKQPGCFAYDTVSIKVNRSPLIDMGGNINLCEGETTILNPGIGFTQYQWSNGSSSQQVSVRTPGAYSVIGTTADGCKSYDTLNVTVWSNPVVALDDNPELCAGSARTLQAGNSAGYLWQDGSVLPTFKLNGTGVYHVTVVDNNQCTGSDTVHITRLLPLPANFLGADTTICNYGSLLVKSTGSFTKYNWSNNASSSSISVTTPGQYWLQVTDEKDCTGRDSIIINPKECIEGFNIPNAFTPDRNGRNDYFKPFIGGVVKQYQFTIYNRGGEIVFTTKDRYKGWDGIFRGAAQDTNIFAWMCTYQLEGGMLKNEKGTVVLIR